MPPETIKMTVLAIAVAAAPFALSLQGIVTNDSSADNGKTSYSAVKPGASMTSSTSLEIRVCHDSGPPLIVNIDPRGVRELLSGMCMLSIGHILSLTNGESSPILIHFSIVQRTRGL
jgi:hypothetical protein